MPGLSCRLCTSVQMGGSSHILLELHMRLIQVARQASTLQAGHDARHLLLDLHMVQQSSGYPFEIQLVLIL